jgi:hypothetical protein
MTHRSRGGHCQSRSELWLLDKESSSNWTRSTALLAELSWTVASQRYSGGILRVPQGHFCAHNFAAGKMVRRHNLEFR